MSRRPANLPHGRWLGDLEAERPLSPFEKKLVKACATGDFCMPDGWDWNNPNRPQANSRNEANCIRADLIRFLALGGDSEHPVHETSVMLGGAYITGMLNLHQARTAVRLHLEHCHFDSTPVLIGAQLPELALKGSKVPGLRADRMIVTGSVFLNAGFEVTGEVRMLGAQIGGDLNCTSGTFTNAGGNALTADRMVVKGNLSLDDGFRASGQVRLLSTQIGGDLDCKSGRFANANGNALSADGMIVKGDVFLNDGFEATGEVRMLGVQIGNLMCRNGKFTNANGPALNADRMVAKEGVFLNDGFEAIGQVRLLGVHVRGNLECRKGKFRNPNGDALIADRMAVKGNVFLDGGFEATGQIRLVGAQIGGDLDCRNGTSTNAGGNALSADGMVVQGDVFLRDGFTATGEVRLLDVRIGGNLHCSNGRFNNEHSKALFAQGMIVTGGLILREAIIEGAINLTAARIGTLVDDSDCWKSGGHIFDGLHYDRIIGSTGAANRIAWLNTQHPQDLSEKFAPQPWEQLIKVLRDMGHPYEAAEVGFAKQKARRKAGVIKGRLRRAVHFFYGVLAGYGYRPSYPLRSMLVVCCLFSLVYYYGRIDGLFGPTSPIIQTSPALAACGDGGTAGKIYWTDASNCPMPPEYTTFQPFFYSLDLILPLVDLQQENDWSPIVMNESGKTIWFGRVLRWIMWFEILFGWIFSLWATAIFTRLIAKD